MPSTVRAPPPIAYPYREPLSARYRQPYQPLGTAMIYAVLLGRDIVFVLMVSGIFGPVAQKMTGYEFLGPLTYILPTIGAIGCLVAVAGLSRALPEAAGWIGLCLAVVCSSFPGILIVAPVGGFIALLALIAHLLDEFRRKQR